LPELFRPLIRGLLIEVLRDRLEVLDRLGGEHARRDAELDRDRD
jgi:hypothetical protein